MKLFLGIDGGGTHTTACLADAAGHIVATAAAGLANPNHARDSTLRKHFQELLGQLLRRGTHRPSDVVSLFAGVAGVTCEATADRVKRILQECGFEHTRIGVDHDIRTAQAGGLGGRPGIALIVGTGSSCYGRDAAGRAWQSGGWGALIADEGSGYWLGVKAMDAAARMADGRLPETELRRVVFDWLGISEVSEILNRIYDQDLTRPEIAAFAQQLLKLAESGDSAALDILKRGAGELAQMVAAAHDHLPTLADPEVVITGGLGTAESPYKPLVYKAIRRAVPTARIVTPEIGPADGAALLAIQQFDPDANLSDIVANLKGSR